MAVDAAAARLAIGAKGALTFSPSQATTSGGAFDFVGVPAARDDLVLDLTDVSLNGSDDLLVQLGTAGGPVTTGYGGSASGVAATSANSNAYTNGAGIRVGAAGFTVSGRIRIERISGSLWQISHILSYKATGNGNALGNSLVDLGAELTQVRLTRSGTSTFDNGSARLGWNS